MPVGRSTPYNADYVETVEAHSSEGFAMAFFACEAGDRRSALDDWADNHPGFMDAPDKHGRSI